MENIKKKLDALSERQYDELKRSIVLQTISLEEIKSCVKQFNNVMQLGAGRLSDQEIEYMASEIVKNAKENTEFIVVLENFLNTSLESKEDGGQEYQKRAVLESKVSQVMVSIVGPAR